MNWDTLKRHRGERGQIERTREAIDWQRMYDTEQGNIKKLVELNQIEREKAILKVRKGVE